MDKNAIDLLTRITTTRWPSRRPPDDLESLMTRIVHDAGNAVDALNLEMKGEHAAAGEKWQDILMEDF